MIIKKQSINSWNWTDYEELGSTNDEALALSRLADGKKIIVSAQRQINGRGRFNRSWISLEGNLFMSLAIPFDVRDNAALNFMISLALLKTIADLKTNIDIKLKWPNDVLIAGRKVSGILLEKGAGDYMIVGIGVNIRTCPEDAGLIYPATSLAESGIEIDRAEFLQRYINIFENLYTFWQNNGTKTIIDEWQKHADRLNQLMVVSTPKGYKQGIFAGIDNNGRLLLNTAGQIEAISAGDVIKPD